MEKSVDAFRTISEVADELDLPQHVLRFWETRFAQIRPLKRAGGRRYYRPADVVLLRNIRQLLYEDGYTIKGVQRLLKDKAWSKERGWRDPGDATEAIPGLDQPDDAPSRATDGSDDVPPTEAATDADASTKTHIREAADPKPAIAVHPTRDELQDALAIIEDCRRILADVLGR